VELRYKVKAFLLLLAACFVFTVIFAQIQNAAGFNHDCDENSYITSPCIECFLIKTSRNFLKLILLVCIGLSLPLVIQFALNIDDYLRGKIYLFSPVMLKVRINS